MVNKLLGEDRVIVSDIAGTTRDAVDTTLKKQIFIQNSYKATPIILNIISDNFIISGWFFQNWFYIYHQVNLNH